MKVVLDTNVVVSAFLSPNGVCAGILTAAIQGKIDLVLAKELVEEYRNVLVRPKAAAKHTLSDDEVDRFLDLLVRWSHIVELPAPVPTFARDADDDKIIACAIAGSADVIVSGDIHLLELKIVGDTIPIMRPHSFAARL